MKAAVLHEYGEPLEITEVETPQPSDGWAVVRVRAAGICGTDLKLIEGAFGHVRLPLIPGHEVAGELVHEAAGIAAGTPVACALYATCGKCRACSAGRPTLCDHATRPGIERDGGLAEYIRVPIATLLPFDPAVPFASAAVAMDAVVTPWHALRARAQIKPGEAVVIAGAGGLGLCAIQIVHHLGGRSAVIEPNEARRQLAREVGAELAVRPEEAGVLRDWADGGADIALELSGVLSGFHTAAKVLRRGARIVCCGYRPGVDWSLDSAELVLDEIAVLGSRAGGSDEARAALDVIAAGDVKPPTMEPMPLEAVNEAIYRLRTGGALGRMVISP